LSWRRSSHALPPLRAGLSTYLYLNTVPEASTELHLVHSLMIHGSGTEICRQKYHIILIKPNAGVSDYCLTNKKWDIFPSYIMVRDDNDVLFVQPIPLSWIFIVLAHWNNSLWVDMSLHSDTRIEILYYISNTPFRVTIDTSLQNIHFSLEQIPQLEQEKK
jgi:hypothetical protein